jgi:phospholipid-transporting ATPase
MAQSMSERDEEGALSGVAGSARSYSKPPENKPLRDWSEVAEERSQRQRSSPAKQQRHLKEEKEQGSSDSEHGDLSPVNRGLPKMKSHLLPRSNVQEALLPRPMGSESGDSDKDEEVPKRSGGYKSSTHHGPGWHSDVKVQFSRMESVDSHESVDSVWESKDALPARINMPKAAMARNLESPVDDEPEDDVKDAFKFKKNTFRTDELGNAGGEALGAVKMPDWMNVEGGGESPLRRQQGGSPLRRDIEGDEDDQWKLYTNNPQANLDEESGRKRHLRKMNNAVVTAKYTMATFLPINLYMQFSRLANLYFLLIAALQVLTPFSPTGKFSTAFPLIVVVIANMARELWEDSGRHRDDAEVNKRLAEVIRGGRVEEEMWRDLKVGDIVWIKKGQEVPADVIQLTSGSEEGSSYVDTCNLDGETNLKIKSALPATASANTHALVSKIQMTLEYECPNKRLYTFNGKAVIDSKTVPVDNDCVILRGSVLRNTKWIYGLIVYAGKQSKIQMNSRRASQKMSNVEKVANRVLAAVLVFQMCMCVVGIVSNQMFCGAEENKAMWHMPWLAKKGDIVGIFFVYLILLNNYVPISLYFSMELAKLGQKKLIDNDLEMYYPINDTPAQARTSNLNEELGQIEYIFSDKTGTLTRNEMEFRKCWIANTSYGFGTTEIGAAAKARQLREAGSSGKKLIKDPAELDADKSVAQYHPDPTIEFDDVRIRKRFEARGADSEEICDFLTILSVSHTVVPEGNTASATKIKYQAESPDEGALVLAAKCLGFFFCGKTAKTHTIDVFGKQKTYEVLNINKFNSTRKRMSMVVRTPDKKIMLYVKGADNVMLERLHPETKLVDELTEALKGFANEGLRTLVLAQRQLRESEWQQWDSIHRTAQTALSGRDDKLMEAAEIIECNMQLVGATAIEDKLQVGVPDTIATLAMAGIRIWVLTGDKRETAENIGFACNVIKEEMTRIYLLEGTASELRTCVKDEIRKHKIDPLAALPRENLALIVDGKALLELTRSMEEIDPSPEDHELMMDFIALARNCKAVIACRVSPDQKRQVVAMVKHNVKPTPMTLSIGDGANDVPMILEASVGIGISGNEGMQAVRSADYAIAQFRFLKRLLLVHGRANYKRVSVVVLYSLYKNCVLVSSMFCYGAYTGWTGTALYDSMMIAGFNVFWAGFGIIVFGVIENDVSPKAALAYPQLYMTGQRREDFNLMTLIRWEFTAFFHTVAVFVLSVMVYTHFTFAPAADDSDLRVFGSIVESAVVIIVNMRLLIQTNNLTYQSLGVYALGWVLFVVFGLVHSLYPFSSFFSQIEFDYLAIHNRVLASINGHLVQLLVVFVALLPDIVAKYANRTFRGTAVSLCIVLSKNLHL